MGEMKGSINFHYSRGNIDALIRIADDLAIDEEDRKDAKKFIEEIKRKNVAKAKEKEMEIEER